MIKNILALFILNLIFVYSQNENKQLLDGVVAVVGDQVVFLSDLQESISQYEAQFNELQSDQVISEVLEELLFQKLLLHQPIQYSPIQFSYLFENLLVLILLLIFL